MADTKANQAAVKKIQAQARLVEAAKKEVATAQAAVTTAGAAAGDPADDAAQQRLAEAKNGICRCPGGADVADRAA